MIGRETRMLLRHYLEQGASKSALARQLGVSRDTIHRWIRDGEFDRDLDRRVLQHDFCRVPSMHQTARGYRASPRCACLARGDVAYATAVVCKAEGGRYKRPSGWCAHAAKGAKVALSLLSSSGPG